MHRHRRDKDVARERTERIYDTLLRVFENSKRHEIPTSEAAERLAEESLASIRGIKRLNRFAESATVF